MFESLCGFCKIIVQSSSLSEETPFPNFFTSLFSFPLFSSQGSPGTFSEEKVPFEFSFGNFRFLRKLCRTVSFRVLCFPFPRNLIRVLLGAAVVGSMWTSPLERLLFQGFAPVSLPHRSSAGGLKWTRTTDLTLIRRAL